MTNADRIRTMADEELAWEFMIFRIDAYIKAKGGESTLPDSQQEILEWLQQEVEYEELAEVSEVEYFCTDIRPESPMPSEYAHTSFLIKRFLKKEEDNATNT